MILAALALAATPHVLITAGPGDRIIYTPYASEVACERAQLVALGGRIDPRRQAWERRTRHELADWRIISLPACLPGRWACRRSEERSSGLPPPTAFCLPADE